MTHSPSVRSIRLSALALALALAGAAAGVGAGVAAAARGHHLHGCAVVEGTVKSVSSTSITLAAREGRQCSTGATTTTAAPTTTTSGASPQAARSTTLVTFTITSSTAIVSDGYSIGAGQIAAGDRARVTADPSNPADASSIHVAAKYLEGKVTAVSGSNVTLGHGVWSTTLVLESYTVFRGGTSSDVVVGARIAAVGLRDPSASGTVDALGVRIQHPRHTGTTTTTAAPTTTTTTA